MNAESGYPQILILFNKDVGITTKMNSLEYMEKLYNWFIYMFENISDSFGHRDHNISKANQDTFEVNCGAINYPE